MVFGSEAILRAQEDEPSTLADFVDGVEMSGEWFIAYVVEAPEEGETTNQFTLKRSYFTLRKDLNPSFSVRYTQDIALDTEGADAGNVETRLKYLYLNVTPWQDGTWKDAFVEIGMVHRPWLEYEQSINRYRVQGNMAVERNGLVNSAGFGFMVGGLLGGRMDAAFLETVSESNEGRLGSYAVGLYNGGGYSSIEQNRNKVVEGRFSVRPMPDRLPGLQLSHAFHLGKGNTAEAPAFRLFLFFASYEARLFRLTGQVHTGAGDYRGRYTPANNPGDALDNRGYSFFGEFEIPDTPFALFGRYDHFAVEGITDFDTQRLIGGLRYSLFRQTRLVLSAESTEEAGAWVNIYELDLEINF